MAQTELHVLEDTELDKIERWRAEELARAGRCLEAVRALYLAVLALLHRADLIR